MLRSDYLMLWHHMQKLRFKRNMCQWEKIPMYDILDRLCVIKKGVIYFFFHIIAVSNNLKE